MNARTWKERFC